MWQNSWAEAVGPPHHTVQDGGGWLLRVQLQVGVAVLGVRDQVVEQRRGVEQEAVLGDLPWPQPLAGGILVDMRTE